MTLKESLEKMLATKEARKTELTTKGKASTDVTELRSINAELDALNGEITELRGLIANIPAESAGPSATPPAADPEQRTQNPVGQFNPLGTYAVGSGTGEQRGDISKMDRGDVLATPEYRSAFLKTLLGKTLSDDEKRTMEIINKDAEARSYDSGTTAVIPTATSDTLFQKMVKVAPLINEITLLRVAGNVKFAVQGTRDDAALHTENAAITPASDTLVYVELGGYDVTKVIRISKTIQTMAISAFEGWLTDMLAADIAVKIEDFAINGTGSSQPKGVEKANTWVDDTNAIAYTTEPTYDDVVDLIALLPARYSGNAKFLCNNAFLYGKLAKIKDANGDPLLVRDLTNPLSQRILGFPILVSDKVENGSAYFGDFKQMVGNLAQDVTVEMSAASGFLNRSVDFLGSALFDCDIALTDAFRKLYAGT